MPHKQGTVPDKHQRQARRLSTMPCPTLSLTTPIHPPLTVGFVYSYVEDLYGLENTLRPSTSPTVLHSALPALSHSALLAPTWWESVHKHPDRRLCKFLARGLHEGFHLGYQARWTQLRPAKRNIISAYEHPQAVDAYLANECHLGRVLGQFAQPPLCALHIRAAPDCLGRRYSGTTMVRPGSLLSL